ncbi:MAG: iron-containing alcohol dehydrogenase [Candidatus Delongbacteria bacterium]|nr:iron-containing alcohol dehydrogenase [Candidatus Delongbacteria bacterium]
MDNFTMSMPTEVLFGQEMTKNLSDMIKKYNGSRVLIVYGGGSVKKTGIYDMVTDHLKENGIFYKELAGVKPNPRISSVREGIKIIRENKLDFILAVGGGSVIDASKGMAAGSTYDGDPWDFYLRKAKLEKSPLPIGVILTLAATGSEMNGGSVVSNDETERKLPFRHPMLKPKFSILDPTFTFSVPKFHTAAGITDIMAHVFEQYFSPTDSAYLSNRLAEAIMKTCIHYAPKVMENPFDYEARANILWSGTLALNELLTYGKVTDWATHLIEHEISAIYDISHGAGLAILFPNWMKFVLDEDNVNKFIEFAKNVWDVNTKGKTELDIALESIERTREFFDFLEMPSSLTEVGIDDSRLEEMADKAIIFGDLGGFKKLGKEDVLEILKMSL